MNEANANYAQDRLEAILAVLGLLASTRTAGRSEAVESKAIRQLVDEFGDVARAYFERGSALSDVAEKSDVVPSPDEIAYNLTQVLTQIERHTNLLCTVVRSMPFPFSDDPNADLGEPVQLAARIIEVVSRRVPVGGGTLLPIIDSTFKFVHFRYSDEIGVIGVPANQMVRPDWQISVLWHEIAGYALALAHRDDKLGAWIKDPQLTPYWTTAKEHLAAQKNTLVKLDAADDLDESVQQEWLVQFFEDLFSAQAFGANMEPILEEILRRYKGPNSLAAADISHPPGTHRLAVLRAYNRRQGRNYPSGDAGDAWADAIVDFYFQKIEQGDISHPVTDARELALANEIIAAFRKTVSKGSLVATVDFVQAIASALSDESIVQAMQALIDGRTRQGQAAPTNSKLSSDSSNTSVSTARENFMRELDRCQTIKDLLTVNFVRIDPAYASGHIDQGAGSSQLSG